MIKSAEQILKDCGYKPSTFKTNLFYDVIGEYLTKRGDNSVVKVRECYFGNFAPSVRDVGFVYDMNGDKRDKVFDMKRRFTELWSEYPECYSKEDVDKGLKHIRDKLCEEFGDDVTACGILYDGVHSQLFQIACDCQYAGNAIGLLKSMGYHVRKKKMKDRDKDFTTWTISLFPC